MFMLSILKLMQWTITAKNRISDWLDRGS